MSDPRLLGARALEVVDDPRDRPVPVVLIISAAHSWADSLSELFLAEGMRVARHGVAAGAVDALRRAAAHAVVLDVTVGDRYGPTVCSQLRSRSGVPIVAVGAPDDESSVIALLNAGADVVVPRGGRQRELVARARALLRRVPPTHASASPLMAVGPLEFDRDSRVLHVEGAPVSLSPREADVLELLLGRAGTIVGRDELCALWMSRDSSAVDLLVRRLRAKLEAFEPGRRIETVRGVGFRLAEELRPISADPAVEASL